MKEYLNSAKNSYIVWIIVGIFLMNFFINVTKGFVVVLGGTALGIYLFKLWNTPTEVNKEYHKKKIKNVWKTLKESGDSIIGEDFTMNMSTINTRNIENFNYL